MDEPSRFADFIGDGDPVDAAGLLPPVDDELRKLAAGHLAREGRDHTGSGFVGVPSKISRIGGETLKRSHLAAVTTRDPVAYHPRNAVTRPL